MDWFKAFMPEGDKIATGSSLDRNQQFLASRLRQMLGAEMGAGAEARGAAMGTMAQLLSGNTGNSALDNALAGNMVGGISDADMNQFFTDSVQNPALKILREEILPGVNEDFAGQGNFWSSARMKGLSDTASNTASELGSARANMLMQNKVNNSQLANTAVDRALAAKTGLAQSLFNMGGFAPNLSMQYLGTPMMYAMTQQGNPGMGGMIGSILGGLGSFLSDRRCKKNAEEVGKLKNGLPVYAYHYNWEDDDAPKHYGCFADEVEEVVPEAVSTLPSGLQMVDYSKLGGAA
jgi:hypothetical protein